MPQVPLREYRGTGKITSDAGTQTICEFVLNQFPTGNQILMCTTSDPSAWSLIKENERKPPLKCSFEGLLAQSLARVAVDQIYLNRTTVSVERNSGETYRFEFYPWAPVRIEHEQMPNRLQVEYRFGLTNFLFIGTQYVTKANGRFPGRIPLNVRGHDFCLESLEWYNDLTRRLAEGRSVEVTAHLMTTAPVADKGLIMEICEDLCVLLSFATCNWVTPLYEDRFLDNRLVTTTLLPAKTLPYNHADLVIDAREGNELKEYLETTYPDYFQAKNALGMNMVVEYYVHSKLANILELKYLIGAIGMECLASYLSDYFKSKNKAADLRTFRSSLEELFQDISMPHQRSELNFIDIRNKIVHTGRFPPDIDPIDEYQNFVNLYDRTVLTILGYRGRPYLNATKRYAKEPIP